MLRQLLIILCSLNAVNSWLLRVNKDTVSKKITSNITVECYDDGNEVKSLKMTEVYRIRISKYNQKLGMSSTVAKISKSEKEATDYLEDVVTTGNAGKPESTFLKLQFKIASDETIGQFQCEIDGYDAQESLLSVTTQPVNITERGVSYNDIIDIIVQLKTQEKNDYEKDNLKLESLKNTVVDEIGTMKVHQNQLENMVVNLTDKVNDLNDLLSIPGKRAEYESATNWPSGTYSLPRPITGCPKNTFFDWQFSSLRISTQPGASSNEDSSSIPLHVSGDTFQYNNETDDRYVYTESCSKTTATGTNWPNGSYCVEMYSSCPDELYSGYGWFSRFDDGKMDVGINLPMNNVDKSYTDVYYCCMEGGLASNPIILPRTIPFYLYRFGGRCQEVAGMVVYNEWIVYDTRKGTYPYKGSGYDNSYHPDGHSGEDSMRIEYCFYVPI